MRPLGAALLLFAVNVSLVVGCNRQVPLGTVTAVNDDGRRTNVEPKPTGEKGLGTFTIGKATTYVTGPIDADGRIDYAAALNERLRSGVTPENNAVVLLFKVLGPHPCQAKLQSQFFDLLGSQIPEQGDYFIPYEKFFESQAKGNQTHNTTSPDRITQLTRRAWTTNEHPQVDAWLKANEKPLALLLEATRRTHYYLPVLPWRNNQGSTGLINTPLPSVWASHELANALLARAMFEIGQNQADAAWRDLLACHRLGRLTGCGATIIESLVGTEIEQRACDGDLAFIDKVQPDVNRVEACLRDLRSLPRWVELADKVAQCDRFTLLEQFMLLDTHGPNYLENTLGGLKELMGNTALNGIDWDPALENANRLYDKLLAAMRVKKRTERVRQLGLVYNESPLPQFREVINRDQFAATFFLGKDSAKAKGQAVGDILIGSLFPSVRRAQDKCDRRDQIFDNVLTAFALAGYRNEHGKYPDTLRSLTPEYFPKVPEDQFSGNALIYRPKEQSYLLYSVGLNGIDDGGRSEEDLPQKDEAMLRRAFGHGPRPREESWDDLVVRMPLLPLC